MLRCLHLADLHLGWSPSELPEEKARIRQHERDLLLKRAVDFALAPENRIDMVIIAGDLFESHRPDPAVAEEAIRQLERLARAGVFLVTVPGNHDEITYHDSVYRQRSDSWPGVLVHDPMPEKVASRNVNGTPVFVYSLAYTGGLTRIGELTDLPRAAEPGIHIGAFHGSLNWEAGDRSLPIASQALAAAGYHYVALGHIHKHSESKVGSGVAVYPGMVEAKGFDDPGTGELTVVELNDTGAGPAAAVKTFPLPVRRHVFAGIDVSTVPSRDALVDACRAAAGGDTNAFVKITLQGVPPFPIDADSLASSLQAEFFHAEVVDETTFLNEDLARQLASEPTVQGYFVRRLMAKLERATSDRDRRVLELAMRKGLAAFQGRGGGR
ncbi:MAG: metallophosphoesterase family protein [Betaproteobacteria bacterium]